MEVITKAGLTMYLFIYTKKYLYIQKKMYICVQQHCNSKNKQIQ